MFKHLHLILFLFFPSLAYTEDYYWILSSAGSSPVSYVNYSSAYSACQAFLSWATSGTMPSGDLSISKVSDSNFRCKVTGTHISGSSGEYIGNAIRFGTECGQGKDFNPDTGECFSSKRKTNEQCSVLNGQTFPFSTQGYPFCYEGCRAESAISICGEPECDAVGIYTGGVCHEDDEDFDESHVNSGNEGGEEGGTGEGDNNPNPPENPQNPQDPDTPEEPNDPLAPPDNNICPKGWVWSGAFCSKDPKAEDKKCPPGMVKQGNQCVTPDPDNNNPGDNGGSDNGGGSGSGNEGDNGGGTDPDNPGSGNGSGGGGSGGGSGGGGGGSGGGSGSGEGNGEGDGKGEGNGDGQGEGDGECPEGSICDDKGSEVIGNACNEVLACDGDAIACSILAQEKKQACLFENDEAGHADMFADNEAASDAEKAAFEEGSEELPIGNLFNDALNAGRWLSSTCPAPKTFSVQGRTFQIEWNPVCQFATWISPLLVLLASMFFLVTVGKAVRG